MKRADFRRADEHLFEIRYRGERFSGASAMGLLKARGALTVDVDPIHVLRHHPKFDVGSKVGAVLLDGAKHQVRGLTQRGNGGDLPHRCSMTRLESSVRACPRLLVVKGRGSGRSGNRAGLGGVANGRFALNRRGAQAVCAIQSVWSLGL